MKQQQKGRGVVRALTQCFLLLTVLVAITACVRVDVPDGGVSNPTAGAAPSDYVQPASLPVDPSTPQPIDAMQWLGVGTEKVSPWPAGKAYPYEFNGISHWLNVPAQGNASPRLTRQDLRGRVVLVDFWTYSCINCIRTLPYLTGWDKQYRDVGLTVVGIHAPEFAFEKETPNVAAALVRYNISYPVGQDNEYITWKTYGNSYWPHIYLFDRNGTLVYDHIGEGGDDAIEAHIRAALGGTVASDTMQSITIPSQLPGRVSTPEIYLGGDVTRGNIGYASTLGSRIEQFPAEANPDTVYLAGPWEIRSETIAARASISYAPSTDPQPSQLLLKYGSRDLFVVAGGAGTITPVIDDVAQPPVTVDSQRLYTLASTTYGDHTALLAVSPGVVLYTFTFG